MKKRVKGKEVYQFRLDFRHINPPVWRCIQLPGTSTFWALAVALQSALGWPSVGLHEFIVQRLSPKRVERIAMLDEGFGDIVVRLSPHMRIADYFTLSRSEGYFHYPLEQEWYCQLTLEKIVRSDKHHTYPRCIGGERMAPLLCLKKTARSLQGSLATRGTGVIAKPCADSINNAIAMYLIKIGLFLLIQRSH